MADKSFGKISKRKDLTILHRLAIDDLIETVQVDLALGDQVQVAVRIGNRS